MASVKRDKTKGVATKRPPGGKAAATGRKPAPGRAAKAKGPAGSAGGDDGSRGDRSKRLLDLVMLLMRARAPVTYREIRDLFPAFQTTNAEAGLRAFERDKADLLELGIPIRYITPEEDDSLEDGGYVIDFKRFRLPEVRLTTDEVSALVLAASVARAIPGGSYPKIVDLALKKLAFDLPELPDTPTEFPRPSARPTRDPVLVHFPEQQSPRADAISETFALLEGATRHRKRVTLTYQTAATGMISKREVDPYALVYRDRAWVLLGWCHLRQEVRSFRVDRVLGSVVAPKPKSPDFDRPTDFDVRTYLQRSPWSFEIEPLEDVELELGPDAADIANEDFGPSAVWQTEDGRTCVRFRCGNPEFVVSRVLAAKGAMIVRLGAQVQARLADELTHLARRYA